MRKPTLTYGVELEGYYRYPREFPRNVNIRGDSSISGLPSIPIPITGSEFYDSGEVSTLICKNVDDLARDIMDVYPDGVNPSCGMHLHVGGEVGVLSQLITQSAHDATLNALRDFGQRALSDGDTDQGYPWLYYRLQGTNNFCRTDYGIPQQLNRTLNRYQAVNILSFEEHGTLEYRILPMFERADSAVRAIRFLIKTIHALIKAQPLQTLTGCDTWADRQRVKGNHDVQPVQVVTCAPIEVWRSL